MVVRLILEQKQPVLVSVLGRDLDSDGAGVDLLGLIQPAELSLRLQIPHAGRCDIHQVDRLLPAERLPQRKVIPIGALGQSIPAFHRIDGGEEGRMAAVIRPVGVDHADLGDGGIAPLACKIIAAEPKIVKIHRKPLFPQKGGKRLLPEAAEARNRLHGVRRLQIRSQRLRLFHGGKAAFDRVDHIPADAGNLLLPQRPAEQVHLCGAHLRTAAPGDDLDALRSRIRALIELPRQILHGKGSIALRFKRMGDRVRLRL